MKQRNDQNEESFRAFMVSRWPSLLRTAYLLTGNHHDAEELAQTALARSYAKWDRVQRSDDVDAYVWQIMIHVNVDRLRRRKVREWVSGFIPDTPVPDRTGEIHERSLLLEALARLPYRQRAAVTLCYFADLTHAQAAAVLGTRPSTVRSQVARALARLRQDDVLAVLTDTAAASGGGVTQRDLEHRPERAAAAGEKGIIR